MPITFTHKANGTPTKRYYLSKKYFKDETEIKSAHREIIFGDAPDETMKPVLDGVVL